MGVDDGAGDVAVFAGEERDALASVGGGAVPVRRDALLRPVERGEVGVAARAGDDGLHEHGDLDEREDGDEDGEGELRGRELRGGGAGEREHAPRRPAEQKNAGLDEVALFGHPHRVADCALEEDEEEVDEEDGEDESLLAREKSLRETIDDGERGDGEEDDQSQAPRYLMKCGEGRKCPVKAWVRATTAAVPHVQAKTGRGSAAKRRAKSAHTHQQKTKTDAIAKP